jgi:osmotically inducible protein OsmC
MSGRRGRAVWTGTLDDGSGAVTVGAATWTAPYSMASRFADGAGGGGETNPEELIAAAHAGCFSMALCHRLTAAGHPPRRIETEARVHLRPVEGVPTIRRIDLVTAVDAPGLAGEELVALAEEAKAGCAVSRALAGVEEIALRASAL